MCVYVGRRPMSVIRRAVGRTPAKQVARMNKCAARFAHAHMIELLRLPRRRRRRRRARARAQSGSANTLDMYSCV